MTRLSWMFALVLTACGGGGAEETDEGGGDELAGGTAGGEAAADVAWADMNQEQRFAFMQETVVPEMEALFQAHDAERFGDFGCQTCHGDNARDVGFEMPNGVAPLDPNQIPSMFESDQPMAQFMVQQVWPKMSELLGEQPYDMETNTGFSCMRCHATAEATEGG